MELKDKLTRLMNQHEAESEKARRDLDFTSKYYSSMADEERKRYNEAWQRGYWHKKFANELKELLSGN